MRDISFRDPSSGQSFVTAIAYCSGLSATSFLDANGEFCDAFRTGLLNLGLVDADGKAAFLATDANALSVTFASGRLAIATDSRLTCTEIDLRVLLIRRLGSEYDFILPFESPYPDSAKPIIPFGLLLEIVENTISRLVKALGVLAERGFSQVLAHCVPPPTMNDKLFASINEYLCPVPIRYKAAFLWNHVLRSKCQEAGIPFIDTWNDVTRDGYLLPEYELDGVQLNRSAAMLSLEHVTGYLHTQRCTAAYNVARYELARENPLAEPPANARQFGLDSCVMSRELCSAAIETRPRTLKVRDLPCIRDAGRSLFETFDVSMFEPATQVTYSFDWCYDPARLPRS